MKNSEMIGHINDLGRIIDLERKKENVKDRIFNGRAFLLITRNYRSLLEEYKANYEPDYNGLEEKFYTTKEQEVTIPADEEKGTEEHTEKRRIKVLKPDCTDDDFKKELQDLLDLDTRKIQIAKIKADDLADVRDYSIAMALDFMVE